MKLKLESLLPHSRIVMSIAFLSLPMVSNYAGTDFCGLMNAFKSFAMTLAFFGTVIGLLMFGIMKIWSIISPESGNQGKDYLKQLGMGLLIVAGAGAITSMVFTALPGGAEAMTCTIN